jgi:hypothetical protein
LNPDLNELVAQKWQASTGRRPAACYSLGAWHGSLSMIREFLKGWGLQKSGEIEEK